MKKRLLSALVAMAMTVSAFSAFTFTASADAVSGTVVRLDPSDASPFNNGEFEGWGTSLCWWANRIGYSESLTQQAADAFFSEEGLGLDIARYNLGGGDDPTHTHVSRSDSKVPGYATGFDENGNIVYDWTVDENQRNIAKAALEANPDLYVEGFSNSPPYFMTNSGCASGAADANSDNLKSDQYDNFAKFIAEATKHFKEEFGITFESYSPMNEPDTNYWGASSPKQEGCHYSPGESQSKMIVATRKALDKAGLQDVLVAGMDETDINKSVTNYGKLTGEAKAALGRIDTHTYDGSRRAQLKQTAIDAQKDLWMSEVDGGWNGFGLADRIITDLNGMQSSAWVLWDIVDRHKDSNVFQYPANSGTFPEKDTKITDNGNETGTLWGIGMADHDTQTLELANKYYFFGQFTRYINPGDTIIASSSNTLAAYNRQSGDIKIVALNSDKTDKNYTFDLSAFTNVGASAEEIRSNNLLANDANSERWKKITGEATLTNKKLSTTLKAGTITTYVVKGQANALTRYGVIKGGSDNLAINSTTKLSLSTDIESEANVAWSVSDENVASVTNDGKLTIKALGTVTVYADIDQFRFERTFDVPFTGEIKGVGKELKKGLSANLSLEANITGDVTWSVSDERIASVTQNGVLTAHEIGDVTITASIGNYTVKKTITVQLYTMTGTASWGNDSTRPADNADYTQVSDGDLSTYFDGTQNGWVQYDYGTPFKVSEVKLAARSGNGMPERTAGGKVQGSNDGIAWTDLYKITSAIPANSYTTVTASQLADNKAYRYFRYTNNDNMANIAEFIIDGEPSEDTPQDAPVIADLEEFTDNFESASNIFDAPSGAMTDNKAVVFDSGLARYNNVFAPVRVTAKSELNEAKTLTKKDKFRLTFTMFAGWESNGRDNTFALKDDDGNELVALYMTGGGYNFNQIRIGGQNVLSSTPTSQSRSNPGSGSKAGANGWGNSTQPYVNTVGYNKTVEIIIDGTGLVSVSATGGMADTTVTGMLTSAVTLGSIELTGDYNSATDRTVSYDNFDGDIITYTEDLAAPTPTPTPTIDPDPIEVPENGELINLNFDNGDLTSSSSYGKASGSPRFVTVDGRKCVQFGGTNASVIKLTDAKGNSLLTGHKNITISFDVKPTSQATSWWFYAAPNDNAQSDPSVNYIGAFTNNGALNVERFHNGRSDKPTPAVEQNEWNSIVISINDGSTDVYVNGTRTSKSSTVNIADMLGKSSVAYIGKANWGSGEFATGYLDNFVIKNTPYDVPPLTAEEVAGSFAAYAQNGSIKFTSEYYEDADFDMFVAVHNEDGVLEVVKMNTANGSFDNLDGDAYKVSCYVWKNMDPKAKITKTVKMENETREMGAYLFAHFVGDEKNPSDEQIYFSVSEDGLSWTTLNDKNPVLTSTVSQKGVRDPYILRGEDGTFYIIATDLSIVNGGLTWSTSQTNGSRNIVVWKSTDLINWECNLRSVMPEGYGCVWAPEAVYDIEKDAYMVFWASKGSADNYGKHRVYRSYTTDFVDFTEPEVYIERGNSMIDTTIVQDKGMYYRFTKDERDKYVCMERCNTLDGDWKEVGGYNHKETGYEGPTIYKRNGEDKWCLMLDNYTNGGYKPFITSDLSSGVFESAGNITFDGTYRHGTVMPITSAEYNALLTEYGNN